MYLQNYLQDLLFDMKKKRLPPFELGAHRALNSFDHNSILSNNLSYNTEVVMFTLKLPTYTVP